MLNTCEQRKFVMCLIVETDDWDHVMQCECANEIKEECLHRLKHLSLNADEINEDGNKIE